MKRGFQRGRTTLRSEGDIYGTVTKVLVTVLLVVWWIGMPEIGYRPVGEATGTVAGTIWEHLLWPLSHANVWHLAGNVWVLWLMKGRLYMRESYLMAVLCSLLPVVPGVWELFSAGKPLNTVGFSGVLCASIGVRWGEWVGVTLRESAGHGGFGAYWTFAKRVLPFVAVGALIPHVNWSIHLYCLLAGFLYGRVVAPPRHSEQRRERAA